ncbi:hypothetical protein ILYODFUR_003354 [Ilyodon furcidens]|uniref:Uncharacterized protein n=1 Tax=Ilyodon furcidens TaxID=33524 RepID=A0ABV0STV4_9TELE
MIVCVGRVSINKDGGWGGHEHSTQSNSAETGVWDHISPAERSGLPLSPRLLSHTRTHMHAHTHTHTHAHTQTHTNTVMTEASCTSALTVMADEPQIRSWEW